MGSCHTIARRSGRYDLMPAVYYINDMNSYLPRLYLMQGIFTDEDFRRCKSPNKARSHVKIV
jgi:hypothetical protein